jgi:hypothetical protein
MIFTIAIGVVLGLLVFTNLRAVGTALGVISIIVIIIAAIAAI